MRILHLDIETYSSVDLTSSGLYKYVESPDFTILLLGYAFDDNPVRVVDLTKDYSIIPDEVINALDDPNILKVAHNAAFEIACLNKYLNTRLWQGSWRDTMIMAYYLSLPGSLDSLSNVLKLENKKQSSGKTLINFFSKPCAPSKANNGRTRNLPEHDLDKWKLYKEYNAGDVEAEREVYNKLSAFGDIPKSIWEEWILDQIINSRGVALDLDFINKAISFAEDRKLELMEEAQNLTGLDNPNSPAQLKKWLSEVEGQEITSIAKGADIEVSTPAAKRMLEIRSELGKSSVAKYDAMLSCVCQDNRAKGLLQYYGTHTGRWAGRLIQVQNLPRNYMKDLDVVRSLVKLGDFELFKMLVDDPMDALSQLSRTALVPSPGNSFIIVDYSSIEARVISWLANETWQIEVFKTTGKIYESTASKMFNIPIDEIDKSLRQKGKVASLALGYQGAKGALISMGALNMGIAEEELQDIVNKWRGANPNIVKLWASAEECARRAILESGVNQYLPQNVRIIFHYSNGLLSITLPSGRAIMYPGAGIDSGRLYYMGYVNENASSKKIWGKVPIYGGLITENIVQAIARDALSVAVLNLSVRGYAIVFHVHDEIVIDAKPTQKLDDVIKIATMPLEWAKDLYLTMEGFVASYYQKD